MGITRIKGLLVVSMAALLLAGCTSDDTNEEITETVVVEPTPAPVTPEPAPPVQLVPSIGVDGGITIFDLGETRGTSLQGVFYFDFDQAIVKRTGHLELDKHTDVLKSNRGYRVRLEGHADERGTREYNLALGERRAMAIRAYLVNQGVSGRQLETISYGEEKPAVRGSSERDRALNRRVVFKYSKPQ